MSPSGASPDADPGVLEPDPQLSVAVQRWIDHDPDADTRAELSRLREAGDWAALAARFAGRLEFGTAGLRAELGAGPLRMNRLVVREAAAGLVRYLQDHGTPHPLVVVGFDARHKSDRFAEDSAGVVAAAGGRAVLFDAPGPTPLLAFAVRHLGADAGVMVTASHNPPADNGYKVYLGDGAQIVPPTDVAIAARIAAAGLDVEVAPLDHPAISRIDPEVVERYLDTIVGQLAVPEARQVRIAYTPMHGVGAALAEAAFARAGFPPLHVVAEQVRPDPDFPTVAFPNPEEPGALDRGLALARKVGADVLLANDPDADRLGVALPIAAGSAGGGAAGSAGGGAAGAAGGGAAEWRALTGNEIGVLLADHLLRRRDVTGERLVVTTVVSSRLLGRLAEANGVHYAETLTGFKWIVRPALEHPEWRFVFGYEEALGYSVGSAVRDKDGIAAALVFAELVGDLARSGLTVADRLEALARQFGLYATAGYSKRFASAAPGGAAALMGALRRVAPGAIGDVAIAQVVDLAGREGLAATDALIWELGDGGRVVFRPSGTEPKLKVYLEVIEPLAATAPYAAASQRAAARLQALRAELDALVDRAASGQVP